MFSLHKSSAALGRGQFEKRRKAFMIITNEIDREQCFLLYACFLGDATKTAHACGLRPTDILKVAEDEGWDSRLKAIIELKKSSKPQDVERAINRAINFTMAHRMRLLVERVLHELAGMTTDQLKQYIFTDHSPKTGVPFSKLSTRALADLAVALEKAQALSYLALSDTAADRTRRKESADGEGGSAGELHARIAEAMARVKDSNSPRALLLDAQLEVANNTAKEAAKPENPYNT
jgi:hypothetical protein